MRCLPHRGAGGDEDQLARSEAAHEGVEVQKVREEDVPFSAEDREGGEDGAGDGAEVRCDAFSASPLKKARALALQPVEDLGGVDALGEVRLCLLHSLERLPPGPVFHKEPGEERRVCVAVEVPLEAVKVGFSAGGEEGPCREEFVEDGGAGHALLPLREVEDRRKDESGVTLNKAARREPRVDPLKDRRVGVKDRVRK